MSRSSGLIEGAAVLAAGTVMVGRRRVLALLGAAPLALVACSGSPAATALVPGKPMPAFQLPDMGGRLVQVGGSGRPLLINFWASWCAPCRAEMGSLDRLGAALKGTDLGLYGVSVDEDSNLLKEYLLRNPVAFPVLHDRNGALVQGVLGVRVFPTTVLVGRDGRIREVVEGDRVWDAPSQQDAVGALVA